VVTALTIAQAALLAAEIAGCVSGGSPGQAGRRRGDSLRPGTVARLNQIGHLGDPDVTS
jgi:hypothetical protein